MLGHFILRPRIGMASGGRDSGAGRQARQAQIPGNFIGNQNSMRGIQQGMKQLQVSGQGTMPEQGTDRQQQMNTPWSVTNLTQDKRSARHAEALREIRHSLQSYEVSGDVDNPFLSRCVGLGFDEVGRYYSASNQSVICLSRIIIRISSCLSLLPGWCTAESLSYGDEHAKYTKPSP